MELWEDRSRMSAISELQKVLDPHDFKGVKNCYIDYNLKYYLKKYLQPDQLDRVLEIGCGIGRLVEFLSKYVKHAHGIDLIDNFIDDCNANPKKKFNTTYFKISEINKISEQQINKAYIVWVLMYFKNDKELVHALSEYNNLLPDRHSILVIEQVKIVTDIEDCDGRFYCKYRTIDNYVRLFEDAGYIVEKIVLLGERKRGVFIRSLLKWSRLYKSLPKSFSHLSPILFLADKVLMDMGIVRRHANDMIPTDTLFLLRDKPPRRDDV